jgi:CelD/BcsL family acetyltransferase involved in cellulose biosynthesis
VGAEPVAIHFGFTFRERYYYYIPSFSMKFQAYSPGRILMLRSMERAFKDGLTEFDFLRGDEPYKFDWANGARRLTTLVSYPVTWSGHGARCWEEYLRPQAANSQLIRHLWKQVRKILGR